MHAGNLVYHGPRENVMEFFESLGFACPERKGIADFLQEVTSRKDQKVHFKTSFLPALVPVRPCVQTSKPDKASQV